MAQEKNDKTLNRDSPAQGKLGADVYDSVVQFNLRLALSGPPMLLTLSKLGEQNIIPGVGGMVIGAYGFFGNRHFRQKGDSSTNSYMGQLMGGVQFVTGFMLLTLKGFEIYAETGEPNRLLDVLKMSALALAVTQTTVFFLNAYLYGDTNSKSAPDVRPKMD